MFAVSSAVLSGPQNHPYFKYVQKLRELAITSGCSAPGLYCADADMSRLQMAIFLIRGKFGNALNRYFTDASAGSVEFLARLFLTPYAVY